MTWASQLWCRCSSPAQQARQRRKQRRQEQQSQQSSKWGSRQQSSSQQAPTKCSRRKGSKRFGGRREWYQALHWPATQVSISAVVYYQCIRGIGELTGICFQLCKAHPRCARANHFWSPPGAVRLARCDSKDAQQRAAAVRLLIRCGPCTPLFVCRSVSLWVLTGQSLVLSDAACRAACRAVPQRTAATSDQRVAACLALPAASWVPPKAGSTRPGTLWSSAPSATGADTWPAVAARAAVV